MALSRRSIVRQFGAAGSGAVALGVLAACGQGGGGASAPAAASAAEGKVTYLSQSAAE